MKKLTTNLMIATAALVVVAGVASAQSMTASIPFEFRAGHQVMAPGTYRIDNLSTQTGVPIYRLLDLHSLRSIAVLPQAPVDPRTAWTASADGKLVFACASGSCALTEIWDGHRSQAYTLPSPKLSQDVTAVLREIPMQPGKGE